MNSEFDLRLLFLSSASQHVQYFSKSVRRNVKKVIYTYENSSLDDILSFTIAELGGKKVQSMAFLLHGTSKELFLAGVGNSVICYQSLVQDVLIRDFFTCLSSTFMDMNKEKARIDFFNSSLTPDEASKFSDELQSIIKLPVGVIEDVNRCNVQVDCTINGEAKSKLVSELYFHQEKLEELLNSSLPTHMQNLSGYEKIRTVGKGAFGTAVLYRKKYDDSLVIVKEINMHDLTASERQLAINEVSVLSMLNHENIVSYYDSFEEDGLLMIEMEYADGGNLAQYLAQMKTSLDEKDILLFFKQIVSAIKHMHDHNILHRDLKTANIFLTKDGAVKVGDFGISKMLTTKQGGAMTVVGTPYYISPEMCEGKFYNQKSDIWALGCILYEMACQQKTFEGSNLPALVNKIVKGQFAPVRGNYSPGFKQLIRDLLQRDPDMRPTATEILNNRLPSLIMVYDEDNNKDYEDSEISMDFEYQGQPGNSKRFSNFKSVLYEVKMHEADISLTPIPLPPRSKIKEVALSSTHMIVVTAELLVYTWGDGRKGQLGHGKLETWRDKPFCVEALKGKNIARVCAGEGFSVFSSDNGILMTCGNGSQGCLGHGDWNMCVKPKIIEKLLSIDVSDVSCGPNHVVVVGREGDAYSWGCGSGGRLGTGSEEDCCAPVEIIFPHDAKVVKSFCGHDGTMFITERGTLLACGMNDFNKLGMNEQRGFLIQMIAKCNVEKHNIPVKLSWLRQKAISVSMAAMHTAVLVEPGKIITFGFNKNGQLGRGNTRNHSSPAIVKSMSDRTVTMVECGDTFTIAGTSENAVYFWGSRQILSPYSSNEVTPNHKGSNQKASKTAKSTSRRRQSTDSEFMSEMSETSVSEIIKVGVSNSPLMTEIERIGPDSPIIQVKTPDAPSSRSPSSSISSSKSVFSSHGDDDGLADSCIGRKDFVLNPKEILALYASPAQIGRGEVVSLANVYCCGMQVYLVVDTTAPLPRSNKRTNSAPSKAMNAAPLVPSESKPSLSEEDSLGPIPEWLKMELANAVQTNTISKNFTTANTGDAAKSHRHAVGETKQGHKSHSQHSESITVQPVSSHPNRIISDENKNNGLSQFQKDVNRNNNSVHNVREKELENEIVKLKEELKKYKDMPNKNSRFQEEEFLDADYEERPVSKKSAWSRRGSSQASKSKLRSKICVLQ
ncbi:serine/threonine-protein kinase Nek8 isoform X3 [Parasteatoda tepidariorum]|uniref:serine/threonine-protein kinase Nek8 isoform X3 n=1 Tax=Parasteatoda tepidariorum TaxID=114398 RepID=UPI0039BD734A